MKPEEVERARELLAHLRALLGTDAEHDAEVDASAARPLGTDSEVEQ